MTNEEAILKHFRKPEGGVSNLEWRMTLARVLEVCGCDWLEGMQCFNPMPAQAIADLCQRMEAAETALDKIVDKYDPDFEASVIAREALAKIRGTK